jgi:hypothetical protein
MLGTLKRSHYQWNTRRAGQRHIDGLRQVLAGKDPILLVHQMGRAGSMTTTNSLRRGGVDLPIYHTHWLNPETLEKRKHLTAHLPESHHPLNMRVARCIAEELAREGTGRRLWKLVTVFREPIARNISVFFLSIDAFVNDFETRYARGELSHQQLLEVFLKKFPHDQPLEWFDREIRDVFGINVYDQEFPKVQGYQVIRSDRADLLLIAIEQLNRCYHDAFHAFLGVEVPDLVQTHITEKDPSRPMYAEFVRKVALPTEYLDRMYGSRFAEHFYTEEQIAGFRRKWGEAQSA